METDLQLRCIGCLFLTFKNTITTHTLPNCKKVAIFLQNNSMSYINSSNTSHITVMSHECHAISITSNLTVHSTGYLENKQQINIKTLHCCPFVSRICQPPMNSPLKASHVESTSMSWYRHDKWPGPIFCLLLRVSSGCAWSITGLVTSVIWPVIGWA